MSGRHVRSALDTHGKKGKPRVWRPAGCLAHATHSPPEASLRPRRPSLGLSAFSKAELHGPVCLTAAPVSFQSPFLKATRWESGGIGDMEMFELRGISGDGVVDGGGGMNQPAECPLLAARGGAQAGSSSSDGRETLGLSVQDCAPRACSGDLPTSRPSARSSGSTTKVSRLPETPHPKPSALQGFDIRCSVSREAREL